MQYDFRYSDLKCIQNWHKMLFGHNRPKRVFVGNDGDSEVISKVNFMLLQLLDQELDRRQRDPRYDDEDDEC